MDRAMELRHLEEAERHVAEGERLLAQQEKVLAKLERDGHPTGDARALLATMRDTQALHVSDRARILKELHQE
jgi:hypothetical protein